MQVRAIAVSVLLIILGLALFVYGTGLMRPESPLSGIYCVVIGVFLGIAGFLMLVSQVFRGFLMLI